MLNKFKNKKENFKINQKKNKNNLKILKTK